MTKIVESISVEVGCGGWVGRVFPDQPCPSKAQATIVSTVESGDLVLVPVGWCTEVRAGQIVIFCPDHKEKP